MTLQRRCWRHHPLPSVRGGRGGGSISGPIHSRCPSLRCGRAGAPPPPPTARREGGARSPRPARRRAWRRRGAGAAASGWRLAHCHESAARRRSPLPRGSCYCYRGCYPPPPPPSPPRSAACSRPAHSRRLGGRAPRRPSGRGCGSRARPRGHSLAVPLPLRRCAACWPQLQRRRARRRRGLRPARAGMPAAGCCRQRATCALPAPDAALAIAPPAVRARATSERACPRRRRRHRRCRRYRRHTVPSSPAPHLPRRRRRQTPPRSAARTPSPPPPGLAAAAAAQRAAGSPPSLA